ncbi:hypothetical protein [Streptomyces sp. NPDC002176]|uniref:hypothetical protein n=1 Tax=Streptomyces sp. NPDC002176 TaxID=3364634 RepID=UPI00384FF3C6
MRRRLGKISGSLAVFLALASQVPALAADSEPTLGGTSSEVAAATEAADLQAARLAAVLGGKKVEARSERTADSTTWVKSTGALIRGNQPR